jgi:ABC-type multidrug transport system permease subunit
MKGLIYREIYLARKSYISGLLSSLVISLMGILIRLSMIYGNLAHIEDADSLAVIDFYSFNIFIYLPVFGALCTFMSDGGVILSDAKSRFDLFAKASPVSAVKRATVKYVILALSLCAGLAFGFINAAVICKISGKTLSAGTVKNILIIASFATIFFSAAIPLLIRFKTKNAPTAFAFFIAVILIVIMRLNITALTQKMQEINETVSDENSDEEIFSYINTLFASFSGARDRAFCIIVPIAVLTFAVCFFLTAILFKRSEK